MIEVLPYSDKDKKETLRLFKTCFGRSMSMEEWEWKYGKSPWGSAAFVVRVDRRLAAFYGGVKYRFYNSGDYLWAYQYCDIMTHPDYRGKFFGKRPLVPRAADMFVMNNAMDFSFGFPSERHARLQKITLGGTYIHSSLFSKQVSVSGKRTALSQSFQTGWDLVGAEDLDSIWSRCRATDSLSVVKDSRYLLWRYMAHPSVYYSLVSIRSSSGAPVEALAVVRCSGQDMNVLDFTVTDSVAPELLWEMLEALAAGFRVRRVTVMANSQEAVASVLLGLGYGMTEHIPIFVRKVSEGCPEETSIFRQYSYRMGDYDNS